MTKSSVRLLPVEFFGFKRDPILRSKNSRYKNWRRALPLMKRVPTSSAAAMEPCLRSPQRVALHRSRSSGLQSWQRRLITNNQRFLVGLSDGRIADVQGSLLAGETEREAVRVSTILVRNSLQITLNKTGLLRSLGSDEASFELELADRDIWNVAVSSDERLVATVGGAQALRCRTLPEGKLKFESPFSWGVRDVCFSADDKWVAAPPSAAHKVREGTDRHLGRRIRSM